MTSADTRQSRDALVEAHMGLADHLARRFVGRGESLEDLTQVAYLALVKAADRFDPDRGAEFATFATPTVLGEIKRHFRDKGWAVRVPRQLQELRLTLTKAIDELTQTLQKSPSVHELAEHLSISEDEVLQGLECGRAYNTQSIDPLLDPGDDEVPLAAVVGTIDHGFDRVEDRHAIKPLMEQLPERDRRMLQMRFFENKTQTEIAEELGISQMHVSRLLTRTLADLREQLLLGG
jgi:RNA polymerase sigma-B factor